jgi:peptide/nickel transport system substrate-binding protein
MQRDSIFYRLFKVFLLIAALFLLAMMYWSFVLVENGLIQLKKEVLTLNKELLRLQEEVKSRPKVNENTTTTSPKKASLANPDLPNLLQEDSFIQVTLPQILGPSFTPHGTLQNTFIGRPNNLHPFNNWADISSWTSMCNVSLAQSKTGIFETLSPNAAFKIEERINQKTENPEYWVHLRDDLFWLPLEPQHIAGDFKLSPHFAKKVQVTAADFEFYLNAMMNPHVQEPAAVALRTYFSDLEELEVVDPQTFIVRWKVAPVTDLNGKSVKRVKYMAKFLTGSLSPLASFVYQYYPDGTKIIEDDGDKSVYRKSPLFAQQFMQHFAKNAIISCGPWIFEGLQDRQISFRRNSDFFEPLAVLVNQRILQFKDSIEATWQEFKAGKTDTYNLQPQQIQELETFKKSDIYKAQIDEFGAIDRLDYLARNFSYVGWNQARPLFASQKVRQAMTLAIDRKRIIRQNLNGLGVETTGPFPPSSSAYDSRIQPWPFDPERAKKLLNEEGWYDSNGDGILDKEINGERVPFSFSLTYYVKNPTTKAIVEFIATALKEIGVQCLPNGVDLTDLTRVFEDKNFDAFLMAWGQGTPPEDPRQIWHSSQAKEKGSSNAISFMNKEVDEIIEKLVYEYDPKVRQALYFRFDQIMHEEQPYTFLYIPKVIFLFRDRLRNVFIPSAHQDLIPGANMSEPQSQLFYLQEKRS